MITKDLEAVKADLAKFVLIARLEDIKAIDHINNCQGCCTCDHIMDFYSGCENCNRPAHKSMLWYIEEEGYYLCDDCYGK